VAAGERWRRTGDQTGALRPAVEDLLGAGAILSALVPSQPSPETIAAIGAFHVAASELGRFIAACASGRELRERSFSQDLTLAAQLDISRTVPHFIDEAFESRSS
jgi:2-phosphosulfolactate phosphatase